MNKKSSLVCVVIACVFLIVGSALLVGCGASTTQPQIPTPVGAATWPSDLRPTPTRADGKPVITPMPNIKIRIGAVSEVSLGDMPSSYSALYHEQNKQGMDVLVAHDSQSRYFARNERESLNSVQELYLRDSQTGQEVRLGDDKGDALFGTMTDQYLIWRFQCYRCDEQPGITTGLYAYVLATGEEIVITQGPTKIQWYPKAENQWVLYIDAPNGTRYFADLHVYNLETKEDKLVSHDTLFERLPDKDFYAVNNNRVVWVQRDTTTSDQWIVYVYDLNSGSRRSFIVPYSTPPSSISFSGDFIVWPGSGYDLKQDVLFSISTNVPGWENIRTDWSGYLTVKDDKLYWMVSVNKEIHYFTAPIVREP